MSGGIFMQIFKKGEMISMKKKILTIALAAIAMMSIFTGCTEADKVSTNVSQEADNFNVTRKLTSYRSGELRLPTKNRR